MFRIFALMLFTRYSLLLQHLTVAKAYSLRVNAFNVAYINKPINVKQFMKKLPLRLDTNRPGN